jgi:hypothetical protein
VTDSAIVATPAGLIMTQLRLGGFDLLVWLWDGTAWTLKEPISSS